MQQLCSHCQCRDYCWLLTPTWQSGGTAEVPDSLKDTVIGGQTQKLFIIGGKPPILMQLRTSEGQEMPLLGGFGCLYGIRELALQHYDLNQSEHSVLTNESAPLCNLACLVSAGSRARINIFISHFSHIFSYQTRSCKLAGHDAIKIILSQQSFRTRGSLANILEARV